MSTVSAAATPAAAGSPAIRDLLIIALLYCVGYGWFLAYTDYLPYVFDGNESFSAFVHGKNIHDFGVGKSWGLTDEAYGPDPAAHPYVYTHQGNFPRIPSLLLYAIGLRSVESQIVATTFTIGLGTIALAYAFFSGIAGRVYALIVSFLFMTDYVLFAQWLVNSFKVWHGFLLFAILAALEAYRRGSRSAPLLWIAAASVCVSYFDILMAVFTFALCTVYALLRFGKSDYWRLGAVVGSMAAGAAAGVAILIAQLVGYYGWEGLKQDLYLTFVGRNYSAADPEAISRWQNFYDAHHIVSWGTTVDSKPFATLAGAFRAFFQYGLTVFTPYLSFLLVAIALGPVVSWFYRQARQRWHPITCAAASLAIPTLPAAMLGLKGLAIALPYWLLTVIGSRSPARGPEPAARAQPLARLRWFAMWFSINLLIAVVCLTDAVVGYGEPYALLHLGDRYAFALVCSAAFVMAAIFSLATWGTLGARSAGTAPATDAIGVFAMLLSVFALGQADLYRPPGFDHWLIWEYVLAPWAASGSTKLFAILGAAVAAWQLLPQRSSKPVATNEVSPLAAFLIAALAGYLFAYFFSPGYMVQTNLKRFVPVLVFVLIPLAAVAVHWAAAQLSQLRAMRTASLGDRLSLACVWLVFAHMAVFWFALQKAYFDLIPPDGGRPFTLLSEAPYRGSSFVVSTYAAPVAVKTENWAYMDPQFLSLGDYRLADGGYAVDGEITYKWLVNRDDRKYDVPDYAFCFEQGGFGHAVRVIETLNRYRSLRISPRDIYRPGQGDRAAEVDVRIPSVCQSLLRMRRLGISRPHDPRITVADRDESLLGRWEIVKLEDDFPPFLARRGNDDPTSRVDVSVSRNGGQCRVSVNYEYRQQQGKAESVSTMEVAIDTADAKRKLLYSGPAVHSLDLPRGAAGTLSVAVTPRSRTRTGQTYQSSLVPIRGC